MAFDKNLDKKLFYETAEFETTKISVGIFSYNEGQWKLQFSRENLSNSTAEWTFAKLGRMDAEEVEAVFPLFVKAKDFMKKAPKKASSDEDSE